MRKFVKSCFCFLICFSLLFLQVTPSLYAYAATEDVTENVGSMDGKGTTAGDKTAGEDEMIDEENHEEEETPGENETIDEENQEEEETPGEDGTIDEENPDEEETSGEDETIDEENQEEEETPGEDGTIDEENPDEEETPGDEETIDEENQDEEETSGEDETMGEENPEEGTPGEDGTIDEENPDGEVIPGEDEELQPTIEVSVESVQAMIDGLPDPEVVLINDEALYNLCLEIWDAYYSLPEEDQALVDTSLLEEIMEVLTAPAVMMLADELIVWSGSGTVDDPYLISNESDLALLATYVNTGDEDLDGYSGVYFKLPGDIILTAAWTPIGTEEKPFKGSFDGNHKTVSGLAIGSAGTPVSDSYQGLFGYNSGSIHDLTVTGSIYSSGDYIGGIVGYTTSGLGDCTFGSEATADVVAGHENVGGIIGYSTYSQYEINLINYGDVSGDKYVGGVIGQCFSGFGINNDDGINYVMENYGTITGNNDVGGLLGRLSGSSSRVCCTTNGSITNYGAVTGSVENTGGVIGYMEGGFRGNSSTVYRFNGTVKNTAKIVGASAVGGVIGRSASDIYDRSYFNSDAAVINEIDGLAPGEAGVSGTEYVGGIVGYCGGGIIPYYLYKNSNDISATGDYVGGIVGYMNGGISEYGYQMINTGDITGASFVGGIAGCVAGYLSHGQGIIKNEGDITGSGDNVGGIAGQIGSSVWGGDGTLENIGAVSGINNVGGVAGQVGTYIRMGGSGTLSSTGTVSGTDNVGGISGQTGTYIQVSGTGTMKNSGAVSGTDNVGGITGLGKGDVTKTGTGNMENTGAVVAAGNNAGGIAGQLAGDELVVDKISSTGGTVSGVDNVGGIVGLVGGSVTIQNCFNTIKPEAAGTSGALGALAGGIAEDGAEITNTLTISGCYSYVVDESTVVELAICGDPDAVISASFYLVDDTYSGSDAAAKKAEDFLYGSLAYAMDKGGTETRSNIWGQALGTDTVPMFLDTDHPAVYQISVTQNDTLGISVLPDAPLDAVWKVYDNYTYVNEGLVVNLSASGLDAADDLAFRPIDTIYEDDSPGAAHGSYIVTAIKADIEITYFMEVKVASDTDWYDSGISDYIITTESQLIGLGQLVDDGTDFSGKTVTLGADIVLTATYWTPIGTSDHPFNGTFTAGEDTVNGGYYGISGFAVEVTGDNQGLFGYLDGATVSYLDLSGTIMGGSNLGSIAGSASGSTFENCTNNITISGTDNIGGIVGSADNCIFVNCSNKAEVSGSGNGTGGISGSAVDASFSDCTNGETVDGASNVGGICGKDSEESVYSQCVNHAAVTGTDGGAGGIAGSSADGTFSECSNNGIINGNTSVGGITGTATNGTFTGCNNNAVVSGSGTCIGGIAGEGGGGSFDACVNIATVNGEGNVGGIVGNGAMALTLTDCYNGATATVNGNSSSYIGGVAGNLTGAAMVSDCYNAGIVTGGSGTGGVTGYAKAGSETDMPIFIRCYNASGASVTGGSETGGVIGQAKNYSRLSDCYNEGAVFGGNYTGGVAGNLGSYSEVNNCYNAGNVEGSGSSTGGVVGTLGTSSQPVNCYNDEAGIVTGSGTYTGGVIGTLNKVTEEINGLYNAGTVTGSGEYTGGVFGYVVAGSNDYITLCFNAPTGDVNSSGSYVAGVVGYVGGSWNYFSGATVSHLHRCYNLGNVAGSGENTLAAGISGQNYYVYAYVADCFNYGAITAMDEDNLSAISGVGYQYNENCYYLDQSVTITDIYGTVTVEPLDHGYADEKTVNQFAVGEVAYLLDQGDTDDRSEEWGQEDYYPVPADSSHPAVYQLILEMEGPAAGFIAEEVPEGEPVPLVNGVFLGADAVAEGEALTAYMPSGLSADMDFTLKEDYLLDYVEAFDSDEGICPVTIDDLGMTFSFTMPEGMDAAVTAVFAEAPLDPARIFTVTFDANGGEWADGDTVKTQEVTTGKRAAEPAEPEYEGGLLSDLNFTGWYRDEACTDLYNFNATVKENMTLYAGWEQVDKYTVIFDAGEGSFSGGSTQTMIVNHGDQVAEPVDPTYDGYIFRGWYTDEECLRLYDFDLPVTANMTLYAGWAEAGTCVVIFDANGGTVSQGDGTPAAIMAATVITGETVAEPTAVKASHGSSTFELEGWQTADGALWDFADPVTESMTLTASWSELPFTVLNEGVYEIPDLATLEQLRDSVNAGNNYAATTVEGVTTTFTFRLTADIELPADWTSIGPDNSIRGEAFRGNFDGNSHTITLHNDQTHPLFGSIGEDGVVKNLKIYGDHVKSLRAGIADACNGGGVIDNCEVDARIYNCSAGFVYYSKGSSITNCTIKSGSVISGDMLVVGILGIATYASNAYIGNCVVETGVTIKGTSSPSTSGQNGVAGILGYACGTVENCYNGADIYASHPDGALCVGGIVARSNTAGGVNVINCVNTGNVSTNGGYAGGIGGASTINPINVTNCYSTGNVTATGTDGDVGGLIGRDIVSSSAEIINSYWYGESISVPEGVTTVGALIGNFGETTTITECYYGVKGSEELTDLSDPFDENGATELPGAAFESGEAAYWLDGGDETHQDIWTHDETVGYPVLGTPSYYPLMVESSENGTISVDGANGLIYQGEGNTVELSAEPDEYTENEEYGPQYAYVLTSITILDADETEIECSLEDLAFTMPETGASVSAIFELQQVGFIEEPQEPEKPHHGGGGNGNGSGDGEGDGIGSGDDDSGDAGEGGGTGTGTGIGSGDGGNTGEGGVSDETTTDEISTIAPGDSDYPEPEAVQAMASVSDEIQLEEDITEEVEEEQIPEGGSTESGATAKEENLEEDQSEVDEEEETHLTVFEVVKKAVKDNPLVTAVIIIVVLGVAALGAFSRYKKYKMNK